MPLSGLRAERHNCARIGQLRAIGPTANFECTECGERYYSAASRFVRDRRGCALCGGQIADVIERKATAAS